MCISVFSFLIQLIFLRLYKRELTQNNDASSYAITRSWFSVSNAFGRSMKELPTNFGLSKAFFYFSSIFNYIT